MNLDILRSTLKDYESALNSPLRDENLKRAVQLNENFYLFRDEVKFLLEFFDQVTKDHPEIL